MKTAVEWLCEELSQKSRALKIMLNANKEIINQAKEMEKQYFNDCFEEAHQAGRFEGKGIAEKDWINFELWYNENFKSE